MKNIKGLYRLGAPRNVAMRQNSSRYSVAAVLAVLTLTAPDTFAQSEAEMGIELYAGLSLTGQVGKVYSIEYTPTPADTNSWMFLERVHMTSNPTLWMDESTPATATRFYRATHLAQRT